jgi:hypothetical protein
VSEHTGIESKAIYPDKKGDTMSATAVWSEESRAEIDKVLNSRNYYVSVNGSMAFQSSNDVIDIVLNSITD